MFPVDGNQAKRSFSAEDRFNNRVHLFTIFNFDFFFFNFVKCLNWLTVFFKAAVILICIKILKLFLKHLNVLIVLGLNTLELLISFDLAVIFGIHEMSGNGCEILLASHFILLSFVQML